VGNLGANLMELVGSLVSFCEAVLGLGLI
jgi:hypothetical protein